MSTYTIDTATSRATPTPAPGKRLTAPAILARKGGEPIVCLTAYTMRMAQLLDPHCDLLLVGDSLGQVIYGLPSTIPVSLEMMCAHGAAVVRGSWHALVAVDMPFGSYEESPEQAFRSAARVLKETGAAAVKLEGGESMAETIAFLSKRGVRSNSPIMSSVTRICPSQETEAPIPIVGQATIRVASTAISSITPSSTSAKQPASSTARASASTLSASASSRPRAR